MTETAVSPRRPGRLVLALALLTALAVLPLVFVGAGVTSKDAGMAFPDGWTADGYFLQNPPGWTQQDDTLWEHGHRLLGRTVGLLAIALAVATWTYGGVIRWLGLSNLVAICIQGILGATRVYEVSTTLAMVHGIFGQVCFCLTWATTYVVSPLWRRRQPVPVREATFLKKLCVAVTVILLVQLCLGAALRHFGHAAFLVAHILWAIVVFFVGGWMAMWITALKGTFSATLGRLMAGLLIVQLLLGAGSFEVTLHAMELMGMANWIIPTLHVVTGALLLMGSVLVVLSVNTECRPATETKRQAEMPAQNPTAGLEATAS